MLIRLNRFNIHQNQNNLLYYTLITSSHNNQHFSIIKYPRLIELVLYDAHEDYVEQFLLDTKSSLPFDIDLYVYFRPLKKVTHNFTRDATRINCSKVKFSYYKSMKRIPKHFKDYFLCTYRIKG
ncbi:unnamed protein product [Rotaria magnacalcarata]|uniref:Uncharacterized protein n=1 Tax=Rotaria magnacalcarata TaxID=392030 RepID=A0A820KQ42_9BILA|nr:unnamed protein product [Rotaria magnacalcarata]CAF4345601.1 unnamed protein product [Rotaria magnacalcarata]